MASFQILTIGDRRRVATRAVIVATLLATTLAGCSGFNIRREIGLVGAGPDEFRVVTNDRLKMPSAMPGSPEQLPEPKPGAPSLVEPTPTRDAQAVFNLDGVVENGSGGSASESALLAAANADAAQPGIREQLGKEGAAKDDETRLLDDLFGTDRVEAERLDPDQEALRLAREAQQSKNPELVIPDPDAKKAN